MCVACSGAGVPVCTVAGPCALMLQHFAAIAVIIGGSAVGIASAWYTHAIAFIRPLFRL